jgi:hypothetical protein
MDPRARRFVVVGNPACRRVLLFRDALTRLGLLAPVLVTWLELLAGRVRLSQVVRAGDVVRLESPGRDWEVERALLCAGVDTPEEPYDCLPEREVSALAFERGRIHAPRQWYLGFRRALEQVRAQLAECVPHTAMSDPDEIAVMFDKTACHARLQQAGVRVAESLGAPGSFAELRERMARARCPRVFVKLAHGSSASGVVAYQSRGDRHQAATTTEVARVNGELRLYNSRRVRVLTDLAEIAEVVDALCPHRVHVERWLPKAGLDGHCFDLRVLSIAGDPGHGVARLSRSPVTNLHLLNGRAGLERVRERMAPEAWDAAMETCRRTSAAFPRSLQAGIDLLVGPDFRRHAVGEVNAFGDLLPGIFHQGQDPYTAQIEAVLQRS